MNDYKELVSNLLFLAQYCHINYNELFVDDELKKSAYAIEQLARDIDVLTKERDAAIADIPRACGYCKHFNKNDCMKIKCMNISGVNTGWEWRGVQEAEHEST